MNCYFSRVIARILIKNNTLRKTDNVKSQYNFLSYDKNMYGTENVKQLGLYV